MMPESWGWECTDAGFKPTTTDIAPAPQELLKIIRCNCATDCTTTRCSCQKHGMKCSIDRKSVVQGKSVDLGGRRIIKKKKKEEEEEEELE